MLKNKLLSALLSGLIAFGLWYFVITVDNPDFTDTVYDIPVTFVGETSLNEKGLILSAQPDAFVDLALSGTRSNVIKCDKSNITIKVDLSKIDTEGVHELDYTISYPADIPRNSITEDSRYPGTITVAVAKWSRKEVGVNVICQGTVPEGFIADTENVVKEYTTVAIQGPSAVVDQIKEAQIVIDLNNVKESISDYFRYTLVDEEGNPVDAERIEVSVDQVHLDVKIQRVKDVKLVINLVDGGSATASTVALNYEPKTIKVSGSEQVLADLDEILLGTINLADYLETTEFTFAIPELEGVTNLSGLTEVTAKLSFPGLVIREFVIEQFQIVGVPEGMKAEIITVKLPVKIRGMAMDMNRLTVEDIIATVDFTGSQIGTSTFKVNLTFADGYQSPGAVGSIVVTATVTQE